jgi:hypothetical protein
MNWKEVPLSALQTLLNGRGTASSAGGIARVGSDDTWVLGSMVLLRRRESRHVHWHSGHRNVHGCVDIERTAPEPPTLRYYRYVYKEVAIEL